MTALRLFFASLMGLSATSLLAVDFRRDVRPILARACFKCHGPDEAARESGLRLDEQAGSRVDLGGYQAIAPGSVEESELIARVISDDPDTRMPPNGEPLAAEEIETLRQWIAEGGEYARHWAFERGRRPKVPKGHASMNAAGAIDQFIARRVGAANLKPSGEAKKTDLIRRVTLDLTGLTPSPEEVSAFLRDHSP
ncbi:MAG: c-type cytochrome domain-containing protein, partial [Planctomycetota bacterium]